MRILITGGKGMLGRTLQCRLKGHVLFIADLPEVDISYAVGVDQAVSAFRPEVIIHAAAMTQVDNCELDSDKAFRVNALGSANVARAASRHGARIIAVSTDYVFDGALDRPYHEFDPPAPKTVYGASKWAGEEAVRHHCPDHTILRIAWLYGEEGPSFLHTILKLGQQPGAPIKVVNDQIGNPTSTDVVAGVIGQLLERPLPGIVHGSCEGEATWFEFSQAIFERVGLRRELVPCATSEFPRPAPRPANSRLEKRMLRLAGFPSVPHWREALDTYLREIC
jgi:dTDP-4-dehydrorhamnose reductase